MPDAVALATKIRRPLLGLLPEALKSFEHPILFSSVPIAVRASHESLFKYKREFFDVGELAPKVRFAFFFILEILTCIVFLNRLHLH